MMSAIKRFRYREHVKYTENPVVEGSGKIITRVLLGPEIDTICFRWSYFEGEIPLNYHKINKHFVSELNERDFETISGLIGNENSNGKVREEVYRELREIKRVIKGVERERQEYGKK